MNNESDFDLPSTMPGPTDKSPDNEYPDFPNEIPMDPETGGLLTGVPNVEALPDEGMILVKYRRDPEGDPSSLVVESIRLPDASAMPEGSANAMEDDVDTMAMKAGVDIGRKGKPAR